ncbi:MAG: ShlB/FhaC/HecB family hemolysin secretion/activation protein [Betaproteobacteria bacterium]|nr:ShlB/FhaC/HecB family hemolysin secretion/activation protein [Betaproteobacteria bacterium]
MLGLMRAGVAVWMLASFGLAVLSPIAQAFREDTGGARMDVSGFAIEGRVLVKAEEFTRIVSPFIGRRKTGTDIERARDAVQQAYRDLGHCSVKVTLAGPEPHDGVVRFRATEIPASEIRGCPPMAGLGEQPRPQAAAGAATTPEPRVEPSRAQDWTATSSAKPTLLAASNSAVAVDVQQAKAPAPVLTVSPPQVVAAEAKPAAPAPAAPVLAQAPTDVIPAPRFDINRFDVQGNTLLAAEEIQRAVAPFIGKNKDFADIQRALEALEQAYRDRGFGVVQVLLPEQDITKGVVQFRVVQPRIGRVIIDGNKFFDADNVRRSLPTVKEGETPNSRDIARNLQLLGEHPVKQTNVLLRSGASEDQVDVNIKVTDDKPWRGFVTLDNTGTGETGYYRLGIGYQHSNLFNRDHTLTAQYITSPTNASKVAIYGAGYRIPFYDLNSSLDLIAGYSDVSSGNVQGLFNVSGSGTIGAARWTYHLPKWGEVEQKASLGLDYRAFKNEVLLAGVGLVPDITIHPASLTYSGLRRFAAAELSFFASASTNIPGGNDGKAADFERSRAGASDNYTIFRYGFNYVRQFRNEWQTRVGLNAQYTTDSLVSGEQYGIGGPDTVRGYLPREVSNDRGYSGQAELYTPDIARRIGLPDSYRLRLLAFYDYGAVQRNDPLPGEVARDGIASAGVGLRMSYGKMVSLRFDVAQILQATANRQTSDQRISAALAVIF